MRSLAGRIPWGLVRFGGREFAIAVAAGIATYLATTGIPPRLKIVAARVTNALEAHDTTKWLLESAATTSAPSGHDAAASEAFRRLAAVYRIRGRHAEAAAYLGRARVLLERDIGPRHADIAPLLDDLALVSVERGDPSTASGLQRRALVLRTAALGVGHPQVALTLEHLAETKRREGRLEEALLFAHRALATYEGLYGARHPDVARVLGRIGAIHRERGDARAADLYLGRALDIVDPDGAHRLNADDGGISGSPGASLLADVFAEMGVLRGRQGRFRIARRFLARAFRLYDGASNASPRQAEILLEMARTYRLEARRRMALAHLRVGLRLADELPRIPAVKAAIHEALGDWYAQAGMIAQADRHRSSARGLLAGS